MHYLIIKQKKSIQASFVFFAIFFSWPMIGQIDLPADYVYKYSYLEDVITSYKVEEVENLSDVDRYQLMGELESSIVTQFSDERNSTWTHKIFTERREGWWTSIDEILISPEQIVSKFGKDYRVIELDEKKRQRAIQSHSVIERTKFPILTEDHFTEFDKAGISYFQNSNGDLIIKLNQNYTFLINNEKKYTKETNYYIDEYQKPNSITRTNYYVAVSPKNYLDPSGNQIYSDDNPIFLPGKIVTETYTQLSSGLCAEEVKTVIRTDFDLQSKNAQSNGRARIVNESSWEISPNPVLNSFNLIGDEQISENQFILFNVEGRRFDFVRNGNEFEVSHLPSGIYFLKDVTAEYNQVIRFVKTK